MEKQQHKLVTIKDQIHSYEAALKRKGMKPNPKVLDSSSDEESSSDEVKTSNQAHLQSKIHRTMS